MLTGLGHGAVGRRHHQDGAVHLGGTGDHVLDVVGMARHVDVGVVPVRGLVLDVTHVDRDTALALFGRLVDVLEAGELRGLGIAVREDLGDRRGQGCLPMVDVSHGSHVHVGLVALELGLGHYVASLGFCSEFPGLTGVGHSPCIRRVISSCTDPGVC